MNTACLLIHGFTGTPFELEHFVPPLQKIGCTVSLPLLPGHGTSIADFRTTYFADWFAHADQQYQALQKQHEQIFLVGFSMGGSLALLLAAKHQPAGIVTMAAPLHTSRLFPLTKKSALLALVPLLQHIRPEITLKKKSKGTSRPIAPFQGYEETLCLPQLHSLTKGLHEVRQALASIRCPALLMHDVHDRIVWAGDALTIAQTIPAKDVQLRYTRMTETLTSHHMLPTHQETKDFVVEETVRFINERKNT